MRIERTQSGFQVDAGALGSLLGLPAADVQRLMQQGRIAGLCEEGRGEDSGRHRITFRHGANRVRLTVDASGEVLLRTRTTVLPRTAESRLGAAPHSSPGAGATPSAGLLVSRARGIVYNLFSSKELPDLRCAVPEDRPVPVFIDRGWTFAGSVSAAGRVPRGFRPDAAEAGVRMNGHYVFMHIGESDQGRESRQASAPDDTAGDVATRFS